MTRTVESALHHRPFATLLRPTTDNATIPAGTVRAEIRALVTSGALNRRDGADLLARLGLRILPHRWAVAVSVPVAVAITAPNDRYAVQAGVGQLVAGLGRLRVGYLTQPGAITAPTDHPARRSLTRLTYRRTEACPGYPVGGIYQVSADARLATMVTADSTTAAYARRHGTPGRRTRPACRHRLPHVADAAPRRPPIHRHRRSAHRHLGRSTRSRHRAVGPARREKGSAVTSRQQPTDDATGPVWTEAQIRALGVITDLPTAGRIFGIGRAQAYDLARTGEFPAPVIAVGTRFRVPIAGILTALGIPPDRPDLTTPAMASVDHHDAIRCVTTPGEPPSEKGET